MSVTEHIRIEREAHQLIRQARKISRRAARDRGERTCLACRLGIHHQNTRRILIGAATIAGVTLDLLMLIKSGVI